VDAEPPPDGRGLPRLRRGGAGLPPRRRRRPGARRAAALVPHHLPQGRALARRRDVGAARHPPPARLPHRVARRGPRPGAGPPAVRRREVPRADRADPAADVLPDNHHDRAGRDGGHRDRHRSRRSPQRRGHPHDGRGPGRRTHRLSRGARGEGRGRIRRRGATADDRRLDALRRRRHRHRPCRRSRLRRLRVEPAPAGGVPAQPRHPDQRTEQHRRRAGAGPRRRRCRDDHAVGVGRPGAPGPGAHLRRAPVGPDGERRAHPAGLDHGQQRGPTVRQRSRELPRPQQGVPDDRPEHWRACEHPGLAGGRRRLRVALLDRRHAGRAGPVVGHEHRHPRRPRHGLWTRPRRAHRDGCGVQPTRRERPRPPVPPRGERAGPLPRRRAAAAPLSRPAHRGAVPRDPHPARTLGTCCGLVTDDDGRVLDRAGRPVGGLFAAGNVSATVFADAYPGGGATLGSAVTRAYAAGRALAADLP